MSEEYSEEIVSQDEEVTTDIRNKSRKMYEFVDIIQENDPEMEHNEDSPK